jgi:hypothetical protein
VFNRIFAAKAAKGGKPDQLMIAPPLGAPDGGRLLKKGERGAAVLFFAR